MFRSCRIGIGLLTLMTAAAASMGCAKDAEEAGARGGDALSAGELADVTGAEIANVVGSDVVSARAIGAPRKLETLLGAVKRQTVDDVVPECVTKETVRITFFDARGKKTATASNFCSGFGRLEFADGRPGYGVKAALHVIADLKEAPFVLADALWGIDEVSVWNENDWDHKVSVTGAQAKSFLDAVDLGATPDPDYRHAPSGQTSVAINFSRGGELIAAASIYLDASQRVPDAATANFEGPDPDSPATPVAEGLIAIDSRPALRALATLTSKN